MQPYLLHRPGGHSGSQKGFTLLEVMIVAAIVAILAAVAVPSYREFVRRAHRADARAVLAQILKLQERVFTQDNSYCYSGEADTRCASWPTQVRDAGTIYYTITYPRPPDPNNPPVVTLTATLAPGWLDPTCDNLSLSSTGAKTTSKGDPAIDAVCWAK